MARFYQIYPMLAVEHSPSVREKTPHTAPRVRLEYLDGVRALAALYVSLFHATLTAAWTQGPELTALPLPPPLIWTLEFFLGGHFAVSVFIILSGYCLMLPVVRRPDGPLPGGALAFLGRRARRLIPPYYAAVALGLLVARLPGMTAPTGARWDEALPAWDRHTILAHLLLVQNWNAAWMFKIDMPAWSVATEWQIYLLFPCVLLPLARRFGAGVPAVLALWVGADVHLCFGGAYDFVFYSYVGLFALGMLGATISFSGAAWASFARERLPWGTFAAFAWAAVGRLALAYRAAWFRDHTWLLDPLVGAATWCLILFCTRALGAPESGGPLPLVVRIFQARWLVWLGGFSYSYYLVHDLVLSLLYFALQPFGLSYPAVVCLLLGLCVPLSVAGAWLFHLAFERPYMPGHPHTATQAARAALVSPAP